MNSVVFDDHRDTPKRLNQLAREQLKTKLMNDILMDIYICKLEGWDYKEYLEDLKETIIDLIPKE